MKIEVREVKVMQEIYIADDGKEFDDYDDCMDHERELEKSKIAMYDRDRNRITDFDACIYVNLITGSDVDTFIWLCASEACTAHGINKPGIYMWDNYYEVWVNLDQVMIDIRGGK